MREINATLLQSLFIKPLYNKTRRKRQVYSQMFYRIFPCYDKFIDFLSADTYDEQMHNAEVIIRRLLFEANFPPPYNTIMDVLAIESYDRNQSKENDAYIARDHFFHIVYLYILGIYIFFSNDIFYSEISSLYKYNRKSPLYENREMEIVKDFISSWKYFCLYHDIGYSVEKLSTKNATKHAEIKNLTHAFEEQKLRRQVVISISVRALARLIIIKQLISNSNEYFSVGNRRITQVKDIMLNEYVNSSLSRKNLQIANILNFISDDRWRYVDKIYNNRCLKFLLSYFEAKDFIVLCIEKKTGNPAMIVSTNNEGETIISLFTTTKRSQEISEIINHPSLIFYDDFNSDELDMHFYVDRTSFKYNDNDLDTVSSVIKNEMGSMFYRINSESDLYEYHYNVYTKIQQFIESVESSDNLFDYVSGMSKEVLQSELYDRLLEAIFSEKSDDLLSEYFESLKNKIHNRIDSTAGMAFKSIKEFNDFFLAQAHSNLKEFISHKGTKKNVTDYSLLLNELSVSYANGLNEELEYKTALLSLYCNLLHKNTNLLSKCMCNFSYDYDSNTLQYSMTDFVDIANEVINYHFRDYDTAANLATLKTHYKTPHNIGYDHGIFSSDLYAFMTELYNGFIVNGDDEQRELLSLAWNYSHPRAEMETRLCLNYQHLQKETFYALLIHNICPKYFIGVYQRYKTKTTSPFAYFSMLCDMMQQWNRPHSLYPIQLAERPNIDAGIDYDITIEDDFIVIFDTNSDVQQNRLKKNVKDLSDYLEYPDAFIRIGYSKPKINK